MVVISDRYVMEFVGDASSLKKTLTEVGASIEGVDVKFNDEKATIDKASKGIDKNTKSNKNANDELRKQKNELPKVKMEWLSIMFLGKEMTMFTSGIVDGAKKMSGGFDMLSVALQYATMGALEPFNKAAMSLATEIFSDEQTRLFVGNSVLIFDTLGNVIEQVAFFTLTLQSLVSLGFFKWFAESVGLAGTSTELLKAWFAGLATYAYDVALAIGAIAATLLIMENIVNAIDIEKKYQEDLKNLKDVFGSEAEFGKWYENLGGKGTTLQPGDLITGISGVNTPPFPGQPGFNESQVSNNYNITIDGLNVGQGTQAGFLGQMSTMLEDLLENLGLKPKEEQ